MAKPILECIPNFSEGQRPEVIDAIANGIRGVEEVKLLHVDPGFAANRTVMTFAGNPEKIVEAAFRAIQIAGKHIDMRKQTGIHPRMGATDVCPLVPVEGVSLEETVQLSHQLGKRVGEELGIPVYMYEASASQDHRKNLAAIRKGEYEGFAEKMQLPDWRPDYGPNQFQAKVGQTVIGARNFLIAYNINLRSKDVGLAKKIAGHIRESGYKLKTEKGITRIPGKLKGLKAIGWYVKEYQCAQVSTNIVDINACPIQRVFDTTADIAQSFGIELNGSELIGLIPKRILVEAGKHFTPHQTEELETIQAAIQGLGLEVLAPFDPKERVLEYCLEGEGV